jgi:hypothetical protein
MDTLTYNNINLILRGAAYLDHDTSRGAYYTTLADDIGENTYRIYWYVADLSRVFESVDCVDWNTPNEVAPEL